MASYLVAILRLVAGPRMVIVVLFSAMALGSYGEAAAPTRLVPGGLVATTHSLDLDAVQPASFGDWDEPAAN